MRRRAGGRQGKASDEQRRGEMLGFEAGWYKYGLDGRGQGFEMMMEGYERREEEGDDEAKNQTAWSFSPGKDSWLRLVEELALVGGALPKQVTLSPLPSFEFDNLFF
ncbi:hypothetical protein Dda_0201 [Drechslerella dactyloides]|uniref:Uncharacterized protein n=1 Tax=Drechslerella dactyloides TaxID=74499 RepID=A0AAD6J674_DREDA|nr:hypothetical protein Dda_0201 [Drechslerella dactyloides]